MIRCWLPASFLAAATLALSSSASAEQAVVLSWNAEPGCAPAAEVVRKIDELVGPNHATDALVAKVVITSRAEGWHAAITLTRAGTSSERAVDGESCASVTDVAAVIVALAVDPSAAEPASEPPRAVPVVLTSAPPSQEKPALVERTPALSIYTGASFLVDGAMLASTAAGAELFVGWRHRNLRVEADAAFLPPVRATLPTNSAEGAELWLLHGGTRACWLPIAGALDVGPCAGLGLDMVSGHGFGAASTTSTTIWTVTSTLAAMGNVRLTERLSIHAGAGALIPFARPTFVIEGPGFVHRLPVASVQMSAGAELHFP